MLIDRYHHAVDNLLKTVRETQREAIVKAGELVADAVLAGAGKEQISVEEMASGETTPAVEVEAPAAE